MSRRLFTALALAVAIGLALAVSPWASSSPDGLEKVAGDQGFVERREHHALQDDAPIPDYAFPGIGDRHLATGLAGFSGTLIVFALGAGIGELAHRRPRGA